jgi:hypothetical protein
MQTVQAICVHVHQAAHYCTVAQVIVTKVSGMGEDSVFMVSFVNCMHV